MNGNPLLEIEDLFTVYNTEMGVVKAVNGISLQIREGMTLGLVGETGAGKTTTALSIMRLLSEKTGKITKGAIKFEGKNLLDLDEFGIEKIRGKEISMIFQDPLSSLNPVMTVADQIEEVLMIHQSDKKRKSYNFLQNSQLFLRSNTKFEKKTDEILELVGISSDRKREFPHQFSGGMKQRVSIAMALICNPKLIIADEPTTALDVTIQAQVLEIMGKLKQQLKTAMILITHDLGIVASICDEIAIMYAGEIIESGTVEDIFDRSKNHHPYTQGLFDSVPRLDDDKPRLKPIRGLMPDPTDLPAGCKFHPRCDFCMDICTKQNPLPLKEQMHMIRCHLYSGGKKL